MNAAIKFTVRFFFFFSCKRKGEMLALPPFEFTTASFVGLAYLVVKYGRFNVRTADATDASTKIPVTELHKWNVDQLQQ